MRLIKFPDIEIRNLEDIKKFYEALEDTPDEIDVRTVVINSQRADDILARLYDNAATIDQQMLVGMYWALRGPSSSDKVPYNKVGIREVEEI
ncbi:hypothetical protein [Mahella australiensis]|uniref:Uncharacterized protein n=1 Tax=Mahella australiensis (strain DSM 15567 / CIP 107919 / 50-1 BON) TaxID=697281 RepID=F3ZXG1_MAHA5|nr:hypothetical protein [Mahella australiensis]AEE97642.1 hypothetical protein Mahau_2484 [Mahella australiensis 50-1 BON]